MTDTIFDTPDYSRALFVTRVKAALINAYLYRLETKTPTPEMVARLNSDDFANLCNDIKSDTPLAKIGELFYAMGFEIHPSLKEPVGSPQEEEKEEVSDPDHLKRIESILSDLTMWEVEAGCAEDQAKNNKDPKMGYYHRRRETLQLAIKHLSSLDGSTSDFKDNDNTPSREDD